jgi:hypothetical protein
MMNDETTHETTHETEVETEGNTQTQEVTKDETKDEPEVYPLNPERLPNETFEDYKVRRKHNNGLLRQYKMYETQHKDTRKSKRAAMKKYNVRLTKKLKRVRKKWFMGEHDVTSIVNNNGDVHAYVKSQLLESIDLIDALKDEAVS